MNNHTISSVLDLWKTSERSQQVGKNFYKNLKIALRRYVLPAVDPNFLNTQESFEEYLKKVDASLLKDSITVFDQEFNKYVQQNKVSQATGKNYRHALVVLMEWAKLQFGFLSQSNYPSSHLFYPHLPKLTPPLKKNKGKKENVKLFEKDLVDKLRDELEDYKSFRLSGGQNKPSSSKYNASGRRIVKPQIKAVKESTLKEEVEKILYFLGWYSKTYPNLELELSLITESNLLDEFIEWMIETRQVGYLTGFNTTSVAIAVAKWLNYDQSQRRNWSDIALISELKDLRSEYEKESNKNKQIIQQEKWSHKELTHQQMIEVIEYLKSCYAPKGKYKDGNSFQISNRNQSAIFRNWQRYILVKTLTYCPVRQGELRHWELHKTFFRKIDEEGNPYYLVCLNDHKLSSTGRKRFYRLPSILNEDLDTWLYHIRPKIAELIQTLEGWMNFWGYSLEEIDRLYERIEKAQRGELDHGVKYSRDEYIQNLKKNLHSREARKEGWASAKANFERNDYVFFLFGKHNPSAFGQQFDNSTMWETVRRAIAQGSCSVFGESKWINPHALRHIAEKHIRQIGDSELAEKFGILIGHSKKSGDKYAAQITSELEETQPVVDGWWNDKF